MNSRLIDFFAFPALPVLWAQSRRVDRTLPRLPAPRGPLAGIVPGAGPPLRVLAVGESTAVGVGVDTLDDAVIGRFAHTVNARSGRQVAWEAAGLPGATVREGHAKLVPAISAAPRDLVLLLFGANDALARRSPQDYAEDLRAFVTDLRARVGEATILMSSVPPLDTFPALPAPLNLYLGARARLLEEAAAALQMPGLMHARVDIDMQPVLFASDGFHPSPVGYQAWAETLADRAFSFGLVREKSSSA
jgi:lysophospholipase L1-like esterase